MDRSTALELLPPPYATALRLQRPGGQPRGDRPCLDVAVQAVPRLLEIGASKLDAILSSDDPAPGRVGILASPG